MTKSRRYVAFVILLEPKFNFFFFFYIQVPSTWQFGFSSNLDSSFDSQSWMIPRLTCIRMIGREKYGDGKEGIMVQNIPHLSNMMDFGDVWLPMELSHWQRF